MSARLRRLRAALERLRRRPLVAALAMFRRDFLAVGLFSLVINLLLLTPTLYMLQIYDRALVSRNGMTLLAVSLLAFGLFLVMALAEWLRARLLVRLGVHFDRVLAPRLFDAGMAAALRQERERPDEAFGDLARLRQWLTGPGLFACLDLPWTPLYLGVAWLLHPWVGGLALIFVLLSVFGAWHGHRRRQPAGEQALAAQRAADRFAHDKLRHAEVVDSMGMLAPLRQRWQTLRQAAVRQQAVAATGASVLRSGGRGFRQAAQSLMLALGAWLVIRDEMSVGGMLAANVLMARALQPVDLLVGQWPALLGVIDAVRRLEGWLNPDPRHVAAAGDPIPSPGSVRGEMVLDGLVARVPGQVEPILDGLDAHFPAGRIVLIVGPSGAGKSTLTRCLLGLWPDTAGAVRLDGRSIGCWPSATLGRQVGYLPQEVELLAGSVAENIARFGDVDAGAVIAAARAAGVHDMVLRFPQGYDTPLGEGGHGLSAGQAQRIALARALYGEPALLVLDEPNAALDAAGEAALVEALRTQRAAGRSIFLVSHRPGIGELADWVVELRAGRIGWQGPREAKRRIGPVRRGHGAAAAVAVPALAD